MVRRCCVLYILTSKCASHHNGVQFFISHLASWLRTRRFSEPTFRPSGATNNWKNTVFRDFPTFSRTWILFLLRLSLFWFSFFFSSLLWLFPSLPFISLHIVGSLTSKLPSIIITCHGNPWCWYLRTAWIKANGGSLDTMDPTDKDHWKARWTFRDPSWRYRDVGYTTSSWTFGTLDYFRSNSCFLFVGCSNARSFGGGGDARCWPQIFLASNSNLDWSRHLILSGFRPKGCSWQQHRLGVCLTVHRCRPSDLQGPGRAQARSNSGLGISINLRCLLRFVWS